jgi:hypothetical protein
MSKKFETTKIPYKIVIENDIEFSIVGVNIRLIVFINNRGTADLRLNYVDSSAYKDLEDDIPIDENLYNYLVKRYEELLLKDYEKRLTHLQFFISKLKADLRK